MKKFILSTAIAIFSLTAAVSAVEAKRLGGGTTTGMKRQTPPPSAAPTTPSAQPAPASVAKPATPAAAPAAPVPGKRSWLGPIAGIAAGLGIAALMSHFGMGEGMGNILTMLLLAGVAVFAVRFLLQRFGPGAAARREALATSGSNDVHRTPPVFVDAPPAVTSVIDAPPANPPATPFSPVAPTSKFASQVDVPALERVSKLIFLRMQAANDIGDLNDLRQYSTPEMFATFKLDLQERGNAVQKTDVVQLDAQILDVAQEAEHQVVSVRFHGLIREQADGPTTTFDEVWHLVKPSNGGDWAIAGITQSALN